MRRAAIASVILLLHYNKAALGFYGSPFNRLSTVQRGGTTKSQLHWSLSVECTGSGDQGYSFSSHSLSTITTKDKKSYDLTSPREWLEFCELKNGNGAYTVMRCDYDLGKKEFRLWGTDFHLNRLEFSFEVLLPSSTDMTTREKSKDAMNFLLKRAQEQCEDIITSNDESFCTFMVTILWQPINDEVKVQGHIFSSLSPTDVTSSLSSNLLNAAVALDPDHMLPNRYQNSPKAKLIAWCRTRKPLEEKFKKSGVAEVLLTRKSDNHVEILEGLTSNLFVLYPGNVLRTPKADGVLGGYARHLVVQAAKACGLTLEIGPIEVEEANLWQEVFVTSSIRVIGPVGEIGVLDADGSWKPLWRLDDVDREEATRSPAWIQLLCEIYKLMGY